MAMDTSGIVESITKIKALKTEQLEKVKIALEKILDNGTHRVDREAYKAALVLVILEIKHRKKLN